MHLQNLELQGYTQATNQYISRYRLLDSINFDMIQTSSLFPNFTHITASNNPKNCNFWLEIEVHMNLFDSLKKLKWLAE